MKAFVFAAGLGTRLKPWTDLHPKALAEVNGKTLLERVVEGIAKRTGINEFVINVHHFAPQILNHISTSAVFADKKILISDETEELLETGGGLLKGSKFLKNDDCILVHNSDILTDFEYTNLIDFHRKNGNDVTLLVNDRDSSRKLLFDPDLIMKGWENRSTGQTISSQDPATLKAISFAGIHIFSPNAIRLLNLYSIETAQIKFGLIPFYLWAMEKIKIAGYVHPDGYKWVDVGRPESLELSKKLFDR